jgi:hypothetical protein
VKVKNKTCRTILLIAFCLLFVLHASGVVSAAFILTVKEKNESSKKNASNPDRNRVGGESSDDGDLEKKIKDGLEDKGIKGVTVHVEQGVAELTGQVDSEAKKNRAGLIAEQITKKKPKNELAIFVSNTPGSSATNGLGLQDANSRGNSVNTPARPTPDNKITVPEEGSSLWTAIKWTLYIIVLLFAIGLLGYAIWLYVRSRRARMNGYFADIRKRQENLSTKLDASIIAMKKEFNERLNDLRDDIKILSVNLKDDRREILDGVRKSGATVAPAYPGYSSQVAIPRENIHTFPISADEYLSKVKSSSIIVKPDFQNGILVQDPDGKGELMLVQDYDAGAGGLFYVVPKVGYFQTKQDFYNYYEKYYDCPRPSSGDVWIVEPAVVDKVSGGWELRDKGELEIK